MAQQKKTATRRSATQRSVKQRPDPLALKLFRLLFKAGGIIAPGATGRLAYNVWLTPQRFSTPESEKPAELSAHIEQLAINDKTVTTYEWGRPRTTHSGPTDPGSTAPDSTVSGSSILLVHGWSGRGTQLASFIPPLLARGFHVVSFDAPAHGRSTGKQTTLYEISETIEALQAKHGAFHSAITHSFGGPCLAVAMKHGVKAGRVINICPPAHTRDMIDKFTEMLGINENTRQRLIDQMEANFGEDVWQDTSMPLIVSKLDTPALVIHDTDDIDVPWQEGQVIADAWKDARFISTSGLGHRRILRDAEVIDKTVKFISG